MAEGANNTNMDFLKKKKRERKSDEHAETQKINTS